MKLFSLFFLVAITLSCVHKVDKTVHLPSGRRTDSTTAVLKFTDILCISDTGRLLERRYYNKERVVSIVDFEAEDSSYFVYDELGEELKDVLVFNQTSKGYQLDNLPYRAKWYIEHYGYLQRIADEYTLPIKETAYLEEEIGVSGMVIFSSLGRGGNISDLCKKSVNRGKTLLSYDGIDSGFSDFPYTYFSYFSHGFLSKYEMLIDSNSFLKEERYFFKKSELTDPFESGKLTREYTYVKGRISSVVTKSYIDNELVESITRIYTFCK